MKKVALYIGIVSTLIITALVPYNGVVAEPSISIAVGNKSAASNPEDLKIEDEKVETPVDDANSLDIEKENTGEKDSSDDNHNDSSTSDEKDKGETTEPVVVPVEKPEDKETPSVPEKTVEDTKEDEELEKIKKEQAEKEKAEKEQAEAAAKEQAEKEKAEALAKAEAEAKAKEEAEQLKELQSALEQQKALEEQQQQEAEVEAAHQEKLANETAFVEDIKSTIDALSEDNVKIEKAREVEFDNIPASYESTETVSQEVNDFVRKCIILDSAGKTNELYQNAAIYVANGNSVNCEGIKVNTYTKYAFKTTEGNLKAIADQVYLKLKENRVDFNSVGIGVNISEENGLYKITIATVSK